MEYRTSPGELQMCSASEKAFERSGQSTIEAAFALPILMILVLLLIQPAIVLYDRMVMSSAAAEGCRLYSTASSDVVGKCEDYVKRRLSAIPQMDQFHVHSKGCTWNVSFEGGEGSQVSRVLISTEVRPLPLIGSGMWALGLLNRQGNLKIEVESMQKMQPDWVANSAEGTDPANWAGI